MIVARRKSTFLAAVLACIQVPIFAQTAPDKPVVNFHPHELAGFLLRQNRSAIEAELGASFAQTPDSDNWVGNAYSIEKGKDTYLVAFYGVKDRALKMELTGSDYTGPTGFLGLRLGDDAEVAAKVLGKADSVIHEVDTNVDLWQYKDANYSVEIDHRNKLYSIQVVDDAETSPERIAGSAEVYKFSKAWLAKDIDAVMAMSSVEIECTDGISFVAQVGWARRVLEDASSGLHGCLDRAMNAVAALGPEMKGTVEEIRVWPNSNEAGPVVKFPESSPLKEIVLTKETREWRIYEVTFREKLHGNERPTVPPI